MKLISMTEFVLHVPTKFKTNYEKLLACVKYANFLSQPLTLGMFVPCDLAGNVLKKPLKADYGLSPLKSNLLTKPGEQYKIDLEQYQLSKERVLFEGFEIVTPERVKQHERSFHFAHKKVEKLISRYGNVITLTPTAQKMIL